MSRTDFMKEDLARRRREALWNRIHTVDGPQGAWIVVDGRRVLNLCSNNYLGFANDPRLVASAKEALDRFGVGPAAVRPIAGTLTIHLELERKLAAFKRSEDTLFLQSGLLANVATIPALVDSADDVILTDERNHASIIDGVRLTKANRSIYKHNDVSDLREKLAAAKGARRRLIITDGVFSMDGDIAPLPEIVRAADETDSMVMVDDAHGEGVLGSHGRGIVDHFGLHGKVEVEVGTLSKAFGVVGGFISGSRVLVEYLKQQARPFLFSSAPTAADTAACIAAVSILEGNAEPIHRLRANADRLQDGLRAAGFHLGRTETPITPVMVGDAERAQKFSRRLYEEGVFATAIGYPTVPRGTARIRCMVSAAHSPADIDHALEAFRKVGKELSAR
jgi:glycine C-acetyltransferase